MKRIIYLSKACHDFDNEEMLQLLEKSRANNSRKNLTGSLVYSAGNFLQLLEGDDAEVDGLFRTICHDPRHTQIETLVDEVCDTRFFRGWSMAFFNLNERSDIPNEFKVRINDAMKNNKSSPQLAMQIFQDFQNYLIDK
ncbi:MAG: BLUF domain-containing protein [Spirulina sp.]